MYMRNNKEFEEMMSGGFGVFTQQELWQVLLNLNEFEVNTLNIQKHIDGKFICTVDSLTIYAYLKKNSPFNKKNEDCLI